MAVERLIISNFKTGLETDLKPFLIDNDAFPELIDAYTWRGRVLRKRAATQLGRLQVNLTDQDLGNTDGSGNFSGNIFTILGIDVLAPDAAIVPGSVIVTVGAQVFSESDPPDHNLSNGAGGTGEIVYATGDLTINTDPDLPATAVTITFSYYPNLPVMGLEDFDVGIINEPILLSFDTRFSYGFNQGTNLFYDNTFYKTTGTSFNFNGGNYQQFWTTNYLGVTTINDTPINTGCLWATNGNPGMHFQNISNVAIGAVTTITTAVPHNLITNDWVWFNENSGADAPTIFNGFSFQITKTGANTFTVALNSAGKVLNNDGIFQSLTSSGITGTVDGIRWFDGDPAGPNLNFGWVNFAPPLSEYNSTTNPNPLYLVGAKTISAFKNRLIFSAVHLSTSQASPGPQYFPNRIVYSQVGTPYYTNPLPFVLTGQSPDTTAWYQNTAGKGGFLTAPIDQEIITVNTFEDIQIYGMETKPLKLISTGVDSLPFIFQTISAEYGAISTFSAVTLDQGVLYIGEYGIVLINSVSGQRIDLKIPDNVFNIGKSNQGTYRISAIRDFQKEFIYFTFVPADISNSLYPSQTLLYNYRDQTWAVFNENYTHYGTFRRTTNRTWAQLGEIYGTWSKWNDPWNYGNAAFFPAIVGGNQQGFVMQKGDGTNEGHSQYISAITDNIITSPDHCLNTGDYIFIDNIINLNDLNGTIQQVDVIDRDNFRISTPSIGLYYGGGTYKRLSWPSIQTKQFPLLWKEGKGLRVGTQRFLFDNSQVGEVTVNIYTNQTSNDPSNFPVENGFLAFSNVVLTGPEPDLYNPTAPYGIQQQQIWHRQSNSFSGDSVQFLITLSDAQMQDSTVNEADIVLHAIVLDLYPGRFLS